LGENRDVRGGGEHKLGGLSGSKGGGGITPKKKKFSLQFREKGDAETYLRPVGDKKKKGGLDTICSLYKKRQTRVKP